MQKGGEGEVRRGEGGKVRWEKVEMGENERVGRGDGGRVR